MVPEEQRQYAARVEMEVQKMLILSDGRMRESGRTERMDTVCIVEG